MHEGGGGEREEEEAKGEDKKEEEEEPPASLFLSGRGEEGEGRGCGGDSATKTPPGIFLRGKMKRKMGKRKRREGKRKKKKEEDCRREEVSRMPRL